MGISRDSRHKRRQTGGKRPQNIKKRNYEMGRPSSMTKLGAKRVHIVRTRGGNKKFRALRLETGNFSWASETTTRKTRIVDVIYNATSNELVRTKTLVKGAVIQIDATPFRQWFEAHYGVALGRKKSSKDAAKKKEAAGKKDAKKDDKKGGKDAKKDAKDDKKGGKDAKKDAKDTKKDAKDTKKDAKDTKKDAKDTKKDAKDTKTTKTKDGKVSKAKKEDDILSRKKSHHLRRKLKKRLPGSKIDQQLIDQFLTGRLYARISSRPGQSGRCDGYVLEGQELAFYLKKLKAKKEGK